MSDHFIKEHIQFLEQIDSTNDYLKILAREERVISPFCVYTNFQTLGKGQRQNSWQSEVGKNLLASFLVDSITKIELLPHLNKCMALSIVNVLLKLNVKNVSIKWPNDIYVEDYKIAGILIENIIEGKHIKYCVLGVGLNINQIQFEALNATSLKDSTGKDFEVRAILQLLFDQFYSFLEVNPVEIEVEVNNRLYKKGEPVTFMIENGSIQYVVESICANGNLGVRFGNQFMELEHHRVKWIK